MKTASRAAAMLLAAAVPAFAAAAPGQTVEPALEPPVERTAEQVDAIHARLLGELMSPYCHGLTLANCPSSGAAAMRDDIRLWLHEGRSETWIVDTLVSEWGESILAAPRFRGLGLVAWLAPFAALGLAAWALVRWLRRQAKPPSVAVSTNSPAVAPAALPEALRRRVEAEIERLAP